MSHQLIEMPGVLFDKLIADLSKSGQGVKESGAFLLGDTDGYVRRVRSYLMYDTVLSDSSKKLAYVAFTAEEMAQAWEKCYATGQQVVADVHTHPFGPHQSVTDRAYPMVSVAGHVALIVPYFAMKSPQPVDLGVHVYQGNGNWQSMFHQAAHDSILLR